MFMAVRRRARIDLHCAHRIDRSHAGRHLAPAIRVRRMIVVETRVGGAGHRDHLGCGQSLRAHTRRGYILGMRSEIKAPCLKRLKRIEGQVRGLSRMVEADRYCIDIVTQIAAARAALRRVEEEVLRDHVAHCVEHAVASGSKAEQRRKIAELMDVLARAER
jgi:CsoR family transcriptional regulator, copper-sensing transcriptional repressor